MLNVMPGVVPPHVLRTKLTPPRLHRRVLPRPALAARLHEALDYRLTLVQAGTGYGKSTALASMASMEAPLFWYSVSESDADPQIFLSHLIAAFSIRLSNFSDLPLALLQELGAQGGNGALAQALDALVNGLAAPDILNGPSLLVIDDYHFVAASPEINALTERFITYLPPDLHLVISSRHPLTAPGFVTWRAKGDVLEIGRDAFAFEPPEIEALFRDAYGMALAPDELSALAHKTEGWPIALQLVWQGLRSDRAQGAARLLAQGPTSLRALFDYLARDVLDRQPPDIAAFLRDTAVLRELTPAACDAVTGLGSGAAMLARLHDLDLFVVALGEKHYRYHHLFHDFLREQLRADPEAARSRPRRAAGYFQTQGDWEAAIYYWLSSGSFAEAAAAIEAAGETALRTGRLDTISAWIDSLPPEVVADHPLLQHYLGDVYRLRSRFDDALRWYAEAERTWRARGDLNGISRALRGQALVYLDTVRPAQAESLLEEALRLTDGIADRDARARLLELLAENKLNMGKPAEAEALQAEARSLREEGPDEDVIGVRVKLRTGQLAEALQILVSWAEAERREAALGQIHPPRAHRETVLLLSLIDAFRGDADTAFALAQEGIALGERLGSPFVTAVGYVRLGHAWQLRAATGMRLTTDEAIRCYQTAMAMGDRLAVRRTRLEVMWGLTRAYGFSGDLASAEAAAAEAAELGRWSGDQWVAALAELALGAGYVLARQFDRAIETLSRTLLIFRDCGDSFGRAAARLWLSLAYFELKQAERLGPCLDDWLGLCETHGYDFLFASATLHGPPDPRRLVPLLIEARARRYRPAYVSRLLTEIGLLDIKVHPGYQLRVQALGAFRVWRGSVEIEPRDWRRDKARQLFQLFLAQRGHPLQRDEIVDRLWPSLTPEAAMRDFKVALNALNKVLEPARPADAPFAFIVREGAAYFLRPEADLWLDAAQFEQAAETGLRLSDAGLPSSNEAMARLQMAVKLYSGDFMLDALYEDWASEERERLLALYLRAANKLAEAHIDRRQFDEGLSICQAILARDSCWENAYRLIMIAYARQGNRPQALRAYQRCVNTLRDELDIAPSAATVALHEQLAQADDGAVTTL